MGRRDRKKKLPKVSFTAGVDVFESSHTEDCGQYKEISLVGENSPDSDSGIYARLCSWDQYDEHTNPNPSHPVLDEFMHAKKIKVTFEVIE